ncbi:MAG: ATP-binding protein [Gammaproteobacteria bacterium]
MNRFKQLSIRGKLIWIIMSITLMTLIFTSLTTSIYNINQEKQEIFKENLTLAKLIANRSTAALIFDDPRLAEENLQSLDTMLDINNACIYQDDGELFAEYHRIRNTNNDCPKLKNLTHNIALYTNNRLYISTTIKLKNDLLGYIMLENNLNSLNKQVREEILITIVFALIAALIALIASNRLQQIISRPLLNMKKIAVEVEVTQNYLLRTNTDSHDEIGELGKAFNAMLETIETQRDDLINTNINLEATVIKRTKELQVANNELESFNYSVSHDLRAPLRAISGFSQIIREDYSDILDQNGKDLLLRVQNNTHHMVDLIESLLTLSRLGRAELTYSEVNLSNLAQEIINTLKEANPERQIEFQCTHNLITYGDPVLLKALMDNLLSNAWKYSSKKENTQIEFGQAVIDDLNTFFIKDNGAGFDMQYAEKLFSAFTRLHDKSEFPGTGIGLATVLRIIHRHEGRIWADSKPDEGATFFFILPDHQL